MTRTYELGFIVDPRQSDEAVQEITQKYQEMIEGAGATVTEVDIWGRRKLAYPIQKFNEGKYVFLYIESTDGAPPFAEIERLMRQNDKVLRYLTVRTDEDLKRAARKGKPGTPGGPPKDDDELEDGEDGEDGDSVADFDDDGGDDDDDDGAAEVTGAAATPAAEAATTAAADEDVAVDDSEATAADPLAATDTDAEAVDTDAEETTGDRENGS